MTLLCLFFVHWAVIMDNNSNNIDLHPDLPACASGGNAQRQWHTPRLTELKVSTTLQSHSPGPIYDFTYTRNAS